jgi:thymidylate synthase
MLQETEYLNLLRDILANGVTSADRTGVGTKRVFGRMLKFNIENSFPLLTSKRVGFKTVLRELLWFISGGTNIRPLVLKNVNIWNEWPLKHYLQEQGRLSQVGINTPAWREEMTIFIDRIKKDERFATVWGELGPVYGDQWRKWRTAKGQTIDQLDRAIKSIQAVLKGDSRNARRIIVNAWNVGDIEEMEISGLPPCHLYYQFAVMGNRLDCAMLQRSVDTFLGLPFNIASYAILTYAVAHICGLVPGELTLFLCDTHIYLNHLDAVETQLSRTPYPFPTLHIIRPIAAIDDLAENDFELTGYKHHDRIEAEVAV